MKIAYLTVDHPANTNAWSGTNAHMAEALRNQEAVELFHIGPLRTSRILISKLKASGLPCLAGDTGGIHSLIEDGVNGQCFALHQSIGDYVDFITATMVTGAYPAMARNSLRLSRERLNWNASASSLMPSLHSIVRRLTAYMK